MPKGRKPLSDDADTTINDPSVINDKDDMIIVKTKSKSSLSSTLMPTNASPPPPPPPPPPALSPAPIQNLASSVIPNLAPASMPIANSPAPAPSLAQSGNTTVDLALLAQNSQPSVVNEHWAKSFWRPAMGWLYMIICFMDFVGFPLLTIFLPIIFKPFGLIMPYTAWTSLTLSNGGLIHLAFGAILGVSAFSRGQEKLAQPSK